MRSSPPSSHSAVAITKLVWILLLGGLVLAGVGSLALSFVPFSVLAARVRGMSASGQAPFFNADFYHDMQFRLRLIGLGNVAGAGLVLGYRRPISAIVERVWADLLRLSEDVRSAAASVPWLDRVGLIFLTLLAAGLRVAFLFQPMRDDEAYTFLQYSSHPFYVALSFYNAPNNHLFHTLLVRLAYLALGNHPWVLRLPVLVAGLLLVPATYAAARSLYRADCGLLAAGLAASSSILIEFSTNARGYGLVCLAFVMLIPVAAYALREENWAAWAVFAGLAAIGFYSIPTMLYPCGGLVVWLLLSAVLGDARPDARSVIRTLSVAAAAAALASIELYCPVFAVSGPKSLVANKWVRPVPFDVFTHDLPRLLASTWREWNRDIPGLLTGALVAGFLLALVLHPRCARHRVPLAVAQLAWIAPLLLIQRVVPFERVWLFALPLYFIMGSAGVAFALALLSERLRLRHALALLAIAVSLLVGSRVYHSRSVYLSNQSRGIEALALDLKGRLRPGDRVVVTLRSDAPLMYYMQQKGVPWSYLTAPARDRMLVVVNEAAGDTVRSVLELAKLNAWQDQPAKLLVQYETACLYEISPAY